MSAAIKFDTIKRYIFEEKFVISKHARIRMFQRNISTDDIKSIIIGGEIIEQYEARAGSYTACHPCDRWGDNRAV